MGPEWCQGGTCKYFQGLLLSCKFLLDTPWASVTIAPMNKMNQTEAAKYLGVSTSTLEKMRYENRGPSYIKTGRIIYLKDDLESYLDSCRVQPGRSIK